MWFKFKLLSTLTNEYLKLDYARLHTQDSLTHQITSLYFVSMFILGSVLSDLNVERLSILQDEETTCKCWLNNILSEPTSILIVVDADTTLFLL